MVEIDYSIEDNRWKPYTKNLKKYINNIFNNVVDVLYYNSFFKDKTIEISIIFTNDNNIRKINKEYRNCNKATNVLSFPLYEKELFNLKDNYILIGDIILSYDTIKNESVDITFKDHLTHLIIHSILHLFGFDHIEDKEAEEMERIEIDILKKMNINNPYNN